MPELHPVQIQWVKDRRAREYIQSMKQTKEMVKKAREHAAARLCQTWQGNAPAIVIPETNKVDDHGDPSLHPRSDSPFPLSPIMTKQEQEEMCDFPAEILYEFLYLGSIDHTARDVLEIISISHILNAVPGFPDLYPYAFTYIVHQDETNLQFDDAIGFIEQCEKAKGRVLVYCINGKNRSAAVVIAYLMKVKGWRLEQSFQRVKERSPQISLSSAVQQQLVEYEQQLFGPSIAEATPFQQQAFVPPDTFLPLSFGFPKPPDSVPVPTFSELSAPSIFDQTTGSNELPTEFSFGATKPPAEMNTGTETSTDSSLGD